MDESGCGAETGSTLIAISKHRKEEAQIRLLTVLQFSRERQEKDGTQTKNSNTGDDPDAVHKIKKL